jgi:hypothetical protein
MPIKTLDLPLKNIKNPLFTLYTPTIPWDFHSNTDFHVEEALPGIFLPKLGTHINETNHCQITKFHKNHRELFGTFHHCTPYKQSSVVAIAISYNF